MREGDDGNAVDAAGVHAPGATPLCGPRGGGGRRPAADLRRVLRPLRPLVGGVAGAGVRQGDRVAYIAPNTHAHAGRVLRRAADRRGPGADQLPADRRRLRLHHRPQRRDGRLRPRRLPAAGRQDPRRRCREVRHFVALEGAGDGWLDYEATLAAAEPAVRPRRDRRERPDHDQLHLRHDLAPEGGDDDPPQHLHELGRHPDPRPHLARRPLPLDPADVPRQRLDLRLDDHGGRRATHVCLRKVDPVLVYQPDRRGAGDDPLRRADGADQPRQRPRRGARGGAARRAGADGGRAPGGGDDRAGRGRPWLGDHPRLRPDRDGPADPRLRAAPGARGGSPATSGRG